MIILDSSTSLEVVLGGAVAANQSAVVASLHNIIAAGDTLAPQTSTTNSTTAVTVVTAPSSGNFIGIKGIQINNADTAAITVTFRTNNGGTTRVLCTVTLAVGETLQYEDGAGWFKLNSFCAVSISTPLGYRLVAAPITVNSVITSIKFPIPSNCDAFDLELLAGGGGGGGTTTGSGISANGGGSSGGYLRAFILTVANQYSISVTIANGGVAGTSGNGGPGSDTTATYNSITYTAKAGLGGRGSGRGTAPIVLAGGAGQLSTNGDFNTAGKSGGHGLGLSSTVGRSGRGASSVFGGGVPSKTIVGAGSSALMGGGGNGALNTSGSTNGGSAASPGLFSIRFYARI